VLVRDPDPLIPLFSFDRDLLRRAVLNLVKNGIEATPQGGWVLVATRLDGDRAEVRVEDTGRGIDARNAPHLFEPFFTTKPRGTGLGLAIARQIAEEHGGTLRWENAPGGGARFTLRLPLTLPHPTPLTSSPLPTGERQGEGGERTQVRGLKGAGHD